MTNRKEIAKVRKELQSAERALAMKERKEVKPDRNMGPGG